MDLTELKSEFQIAFEDLATSGSKGLDDYEISVCLTNGQEMLVLQLLQAKDMTALRAVTVDESTSASTGDSIFPGGIKYSLVSQILAVLDRVVISENKENIGVTAVPPGVITEMYKAAYKYPPKNVAYVMVGENTEVVFPPLNFNIKAYMYSYIKQPKAIVLEGVVSDAGISIPSNPPTLLAPLHRRIIDGAVKYAVKTYIGQPEKSIGNDNNRDK